MLKEQILGPMSFLIIEPRSTESDISEANCSSNFHRSFNQVSFDIEKNHQSTQKKKKKMFLKYERLVCAHIFTINQTRNVATSCPNAFHHIKYSSIYPPLGVSKHIQGLSMCHFRETSGQLFLMDMNELKLKEALAISSKLSSEHLDNNVRSKY